MVINWLTRVLWTDADRYRRSGPDGREYRPPADAAWPRMRGVRRQSRRQPDAWAREGATSSAALQDLVKRLKAPRVVWLMLPAGEVTEKAVAELAGLMAAGDTIIDGGNTFWKDDIAPRRGAEAARHPLSRHRHQRRRVGARARLLPDDRRREARSSSGSIRSSARSRPARATFRRRRIARAAIRGPGRATSTPGRTAPGISSR